MSYDLCIIGAGMFGSAAARHASANPALKVCLVGPSEPTIEERNNREIFSSHYDAGRISRVLDEDPAAEVLSKHSIKRYKEIEKLSGITFYSPVGLVSIVQKNGPTLKTLNQSIDAKDISITELSKEMFQRRFPYLHKTDEETVLLDDNGSGHIDPRKLVQAQIKIAKLQGCDVLESVVSNVKLDEGVYQVITESNKTITAKRVLVATGAFINSKKFEVLKPLKVKKFKETVTLYKVSEEEVKRLSSMPNVVHNGKSEPMLPNGLFTYLLPPIKYPDGNYYLKLGMDDFSGEASDLDDIKNWYLTKDGNKQIVERETDMIKKLIPGVKFSSIQSLTCVYCSTPTAIPYIDRITPTLTVAIGGNGKGAKLSDEVGRLAAQLSVTGNWDSELKKCRFEAIFQE